MNQGFVQENILLDQFLWMKALGIFCIFLDKTSVPADRCLAFASLNFHYLEEGPRDELISISGCSANAPYAQNIGADLLRFANFFQWTKYFNRIQSRYHNVGIAFVNNFCVKHYSYFLFVAAVSHNFEPTF